MYEEEVPGEIWAVEGHLTHYPPDLQSDLFFYEHSQTSLIYCNRTRILSCLCYCPTNILTVVAAKERKHEGTTTKDINSGYSVWNESTLMCRVQNTCSFKYQITLLTISSYCKEPLWPKLRIIWKFKVSILRILDLDSIT